MKKGTSVSKTTQGGYALTDLQKTDVLFGRGNGIAHHYGNIMFRDEVNSLKDDYHKAERCSKRLIAEKVVECLREKGARFLFIVNAEKKLYAKASQIQAVEKTCQALREKKFRKTTTTLVDGKPTVAPVAFVGGNFYADKQRLKQVTRPRKMDVVITAGLDVTEGSRQFRELLGSAEGAAVLDMVQQWTLSHTMSSFLVPQGKSYQSVADSLAAKKIRILLSRQRRPKSAPNPKAPKSISMPIKKATKPVAKQKTTSVKKKAATEPKLSPLPSAPIESVFASSTALDAQVLVSMAMRSSVVTPDHKRGEDESISSAESMDVTQDVELATAAILMRLHGSA